MPEEEQQALYDLLTGRKLKLMPKMAAHLRKASGELDEEKMLEIVDGLKVKKSANGVTLKLPMAACSKYFEGMNAEQMLLLWSRHWKRGLPERRLLMLSNEDLKCLDPKYFSFITTDAYDVTIMSRNTGHYWYLHNPEYPEQGTVIIFHKHKASHPYH